MKQWCQMMHTECLAQLAAHPAGRQALLEDPAALPAVREVQDKGLSEQAREFAGAALAALEDRQPEHDDDDNSGCPKHVMLSYQWNSQNTVKRTIRC